MNNFSKIWDLILIYSYVIFFKLSLIIMEELRCEIVGTDFSTSLNTIKNFNKHINEEEVIKRIGLFKLKAEDIHEVMVSIRNE